MSFDPRRGGIGIGRDAPFRVDELERVNREHLDDEEAAEIETHIRARDELIATLQTDLVGIQSERDALTHRVEVLEKERDSLLDRLDGFEATRPMLEPDAVFTDFGDALTAASAELSGTNYAVSDLHVDFKTLVVNTDEGIRFHLPEPSESVLSESISTFRFDLTATAKKPETTFVSVPDVRFVDREAAEAVIARAGLTVGSVDVITSDDQPGTVIEQFPSPFSLTEPEMPVDLVLADGEVERVLDERDVTQPERESRGIVALTEISGVGETFARRLENANIKRVVEVASADPEELAVVLGTSVGRAEKIISDAQRLK
ncbi:PASTA domain-containing protein [Haladaptatus sp. ZSTT2]|uniref:PASTA domain-containing protein n=1 Tax=Haladaptatus sp. ZSTT2 TaxID=3120515 RepID=UPI00300F3595